MSDAVAIALIAAIASTLAAIISAVALMKTRTTHDLINSRMTELLAVTKSAAHAEGVAAGEQSQRDRQAPPEVNS